MRSDLLLARDALLDLIRVVSNLLQGGLAFKAHRLLYHSTLGLRVIKKKKESVSGFGFRLQGSRFRDVRQDATGGFCRKEFQFKTLMQ